MSKIEMLAGSGPGEGPLAGLQTAVFLLCHHMVGERESKLSGISSYQDTDPIRPGPLPHYFI